MNSREITESANDIAWRAKFLHQAVKRVRFIDLQAVDNMGTAVEELQHTIIEICEEFDEEDAQGFRKPQPGPPRPLYDTLEEKKQALEGP